MKIKFGILTNIQIIVVGLVVFGLFYFYYGTENYFVKKRLRHDLDSLNQTVDSLRDEITKDSVMLENLRKDDKYLEKYARETFYMHGEGEEVYISE